ncbi:unnamed protein product [Cochlearia groenlandica]
MASMASSPISFTSSFLKIKQFLPLSPLFLPLRTLRYALSSSPETIEFDISFAPLKPTFPSTRGGSAAVQQLFIPTSEELIFDGKVTVSGSLCIIPQTRVDPTRDIIYANGNRVPKKLPPKVYFAVNKPKGLVSLMYSSHL